MADAGIGVPVEQRIGIVGQAHTFWRLHRGHDLGPELADIRRKDRVRDGVGNGLVPGKIAGVGQRRVGAVEHAQLHVLMRGHVLHHLDTCCREIRPRAANEIILDHPLGKGFVHHWRCIDMACQLGNAGNVGLGGGRRDAVHHRRWEPPFGGDPVGQRGVQSLRKLQHQTAHQTAIFRKVVTGQHGKGRVPRRATTRQSSHQKAGSGHRQIMGKVVLDVGMIGVQRAGGRVVAIALFRDRQADDPNRRVRHRVKHRVGVFGRDQHVVQNIDPARLLAFRRKRDGCIAPALPLQRIARVRAAQGHAGDAPVTTRRRHRVGHEHTSEAAKKRAKAQMHDPRLGALSGVSGQASLHRH